MTTDPAKFPRQEPLPKRDPLSIQIDLLTWRIRTSVTLEAKMRHARELVRLKRERGDLARVEQLLVIDEKVVEIFAHDEIDRIAALREKADLAGERTDEEDQA